MTESIKELKKTLGIIFKCEVNSINLTVYDSSSNLYLTVEDFHNQYNPAELQKGHCNLVFKLEFDQEPICTFMLKDMVGCCGILVFHDLFVSIRCRKNGIATEMVKFVEKFAKYYGYGIIQATDVEDSEYTNKLLEKQGWTNVAVFVNPKTKNNVILWNKILENKV